MTTTILRSDSAVYGAKFQNNASETTFSTPVGVQGDTGGKFRAGEDPADETVSRKTIVAAGDAPVQPLASDLPVATQAPEEKAGMTEDDTVSVLEVLDEMQRIIDRHLAKAEKRQGDR